MQIFTLHQVIGNTSGIRDEIKQCEVFHHPELSISIALSREEFAFILRRMKRDAGPQTVILKKEEDAA